MKLGFKLGLGVSDSGCLGHGIDFYVGGVAKDCRSGDAQIRRIYLDVPHSENPKSSWYGESVGHYAGDTLVIDTIGMNNKTYVDNYRTPHTERLHVEERWRLINDTTLELTFKVEDPDTFNEPWSAIYHFRRIQRPLDYEEVCAENNNPLFDYHTPTADKPDF